MNRRIREKREDGEERFGHITERDLGLILCEQRESLLPVDYRASIGKECDERNILKIGRVAIENEFKEETAEYLRETLLELENVGNGIVPKHSRLLSPENLDALLRTENRLLENPARRGNL